MAQGPGMVIFGIAVRARTQKLEIIDVDRARPFQLAVDDRGRLRAAAIRAFGDAADRVRNDVAKLAVKIAVIGAAAEFAVGRKPQADPLLQRDRVGDGAVFRGGERFVGDFAAFELPAQVEQILRPQQAADMFGAKGWGVRHARSDLQKEPSRKG